MGKVKKGLQMIMVLSLAASLFTGCGKSKSDSADDGKDASKPITLKFFDKNFDKPFTTPVAQEITKRTGVNIEMAPTTGNAEEKLNLMLASNDFPDIVLIDRSKDLINKYIAAGALTPLDDLIEKYGPNIKKMYGDILKKSRHSDGKIYYLNNWYTLEKEPVFGIQMRKDLLIELGEAERANDPSKPFTSEEYYQLLKKFKEKYPTIDGKATIGATWDFSNFDQLTGTFKGMFGIGSVYKDNGLLKHDIRDPQYLEMLKYMNKLVREGLVDPEFVVNKQETWKQKAANGNVFSTEGAYWDLNSPNAILRKANGQENLDRQFYPYKVTGPGVDPSKTTYGPRGALGWDAIGITKSNPDPVRTIKLFDFLASEEGQYLLMWGVQGTTWEMKDGKHTPINNIIERFQGSWDNTADETGVRRYMWFVNNGSGSDGTPFDMATKYKREPVNSHALKALGDSIYDTTEFDNLRPDGGTPEALINQKYDDVKKTSVAKILMAKSEEEAVGLYNNMIKELDSIGAAKLEDIMNKKYKERMELWK